MSEDTLQRLLYYKGQLLTAKDFDDQQKYHRTKLRQLTARFPYGIVNGLAVIYDPGESSNPEPIVIQEGLAIDIKGDFIALSEHRVSLEGFDSKHCYLSIKYSERPTCSNQSGCETTLKNNRIEESLETKWDGIPNRVTRDNNNNITESYITVARLRPKKESKDEEWEKSQKDKDKKSSSSFLILEKNEPGLPTIRLDAGLIGEDQLKKEVKDKLVTDAITQKLVTNGDSHDHSSGDGAQIPLTGLDNAVQTKINSIPADLANKLVSNGDGHDHSGGDGAQILLTGLDNAVQTKINSIPADLANKLVTNGDTHDHSGGDGATIPLSGLGSDVTNKLVKVTSEFFTATTSPFEIPKTFPDQKLRIPNIIPIASNTKIQWSYVIEALPGPNTNFTFTINVITDSGNNTCRLDFIEIGI